MFDLKGHIHTVCLVGPIDVTDLTEAAVVKDVNLSHIPFRYSPALGAIQKDGLNIAVVSLNLVLRLYCLNFQMLRSRPKAPLAMLRRAWMFLWAPLSLLMIEASEICEVFNALQHFSINCDRRCCWRIDKHHLGVFLVDVQTSSLCEIA